VASALVRTKVLTPITASIDTASVKVDPVRVDVTLIDRCNKTPAALLHTTAEDEIHTLPVDAVPCSARNAIVDTPRFELPNTVMLCAPVPAALVLVTLLTTNESMLIVLVSVCNKLILPPIVTATLLTLADVPRPILHSRADDDVHSVPSAPLPPTRTHPE
jgi:hypothetical protein